MAQIDIRHVETDRVEDFFRTMSVTFLHPQPMTEPVVAFLQQHWDPARSWGAFDGETIVGTLRTDERRLTLPGVDGSTVDVVVDALTNVTVAATHRRQGLLRRMLTESLDAAAGRGDALSILIAAEWPIYGRFGYAPTLQWSEMKIDRRRRGAVLSTPPTGSYREVPMAQASEVLPGIFERSRYARAGQIDRPPRWWQRHVENELRPPDAPAQVIVVHTGPDGDDGVVVWHSSDGFDLDKGGAITVDDLYGTSPEAEHALWGYLLGMDIIDTVTVSNRPADDPLPYLLEDGRSVARTTVDGMWLRILDVPKALSSRRYAVADRLCLDVTDTDVGGFAAGRYVLDGGPQTATCLPAGEAEPDLRLSQRALAAIYLGGESLTVHRIAGNVEELTPGAIGRAERMFRTSLQPWLATGF